MNCHSRTGCIVEKIDSPLFGEDCSAPIFFEPAGLAHENMEWVAVF